MDNQQLSLYRKVQRLSQKRVQYKRLILEKVSPKVFILRKRYNCACMKMQEAL